MKESESFSDNAEKVAQLADVGSFVGDQSAKYLKANAIKALIARTQKNPSQAQAAAAKANSLQLQKAANLAKIGSRGLGAVALAPSIYDAATTEGTEQVGHIASTGVNVAGLLAPVFGAGSAIGGALSYPIQYGLKKAFGDKYGDPQFTLNPFADVARDLPTFVETQQNNATYEQLERNQRHAAAVREFNAANFRRVKKLPDANDKKINAVAARLSGRREVGNVVKQVAPSLEREPYTSEVDYFKQNPGTAGMATEDNRVIVNPYSNLSEIERKALIKNETSRVFMRNNERERPLFSITPEQRNAFKNYGSEQDIRETIAARILSGDPSAGAATKEQMAFASNLERKMQSTKPEQYSVLPIPQRPVALDPYTNTSPKQ